MQKHPSLPIIQTSLREETVTHIFCPLSSQDSGISGILEDVMISVVSNGGGVFRKDDTRVCVGVR